MLIIKKNLTSMLFHKRFILALCVTLGILYGFFAHFGYYANIEYFLHTTLILLYSTLMFFNIFKFFFRRDLKHKTVLITNFLILFLLILNFIISIITDINHKTEDLCQAIIITILMYTISIHPDSIVFTETKETIHTKHNNNIVFITIYFIAYITLFFSVLIYDIPTYIVLTFIQIPILYFFITIIEEKRSLLFKTNTRINSTLLIFLIAASFQTGYILNPSESYTSQLVIFILSLCFFEICSKIYSYILNNFKHIQSDSLRLARNMGKLSTIHIEAQKAKISKENFLAIMSHEIRTPVNGIIGYTELLRTTDTNEEQQRLLNMITISSTNLTKLIDDVLDLPNLLLGKYSLNVIHFKLSNVIENIIEIVSPKCYEKGLELNYFIEPTVPNIINGDQKRLEQIILNLTNNALKFTHKGEVFIGISQIDSFSDNEIELVFEIRDTGIGIPHDKIKNLFKPYTQSDVSITRKYGGTGLGLSISAQLISMMGGRIWVESIINKGSRFFFTLKCDLIPSQNITIDPNNNTLGKKCLIISESSTMQYILGRYFRQWKMIPKICYNLEEAQHLISTEEFNLILIDIINDPKKSIIFLKVNRINPTGKIPAIALVNMGSKIVNDIQLITDKTIQKPLRKETLYNSIINILNPSLSKTNQTEETKKEPKSNTHQINNTETIDNTKTHILNIIIAEDNVVNQKLILNILNKRGHKCTLVENGLEAFEAAKSKLFDIILMDIQMPIMDGIEASRNIISFYENRKRPQIVALTANAMIGDKEKYMEAGMDHYISKPIQLEELNKVLNQVIPISDEKSESKEINKVESTQEKENRKLKILVAEDNVVNQKLITNILKKQGHSVTLVENGLLATEESEKNDYEIIIMDLQMPIMDGIEATKIILNNKNIKIKPKIIALTANVYLENKEKCFEVGMLDFLTKPLQINLLSEALLKWGTIAQEERRK